MTVRQASKHPDYEDTSDNYSYDVGLIFLNERIQNNIQLPILNDECAILNNECTFPAEGSTTYALGWGITDTTTSSLPNDLQIVDLAVITNAQCSNDYPGDINSDMLCTFNQGKGKQTFVFCGSYLSTAILTSFSTPLISQRCMPGRFR